MKKRQKLLRNIKSLSENLKRLGSKMLELKKQHHKDALVKAKNDVYMIQKNLYWNYYYLNISNTDLNVKFRNLPMYKKKMNRRRKYSHNKLGIAKMVIMDIQ